MYYKMYITDALRVIGHLDRRWVDMIIDKPVEHRSPDEIKNGIRDKLRRMGNGSI